MHRVKVVCWAGTVLGLAGCSSGFPLAGAGGFAEHNYESIAPVEAGGPITPEHGLRFDFELSRQLLKLLVNDGAELCFPATVAQARERESRIGRELAGGLEFDAANDILIQRNQLNRLERQLNAALSDQTCRLEPEHAGSNPVSVAAEIEQLLNADNQFAFGSSELNPKYIGRLAQAAVLLKQFPRYQLQVIGHADQIGTERNNLNLSLERAQQVSRYLQIFGMDKDKIEVTALGEGSPLAEGIAPQNRLVNRRVSIVLVETTNRFSHQTLAQQ